MFKELPNKLNLENTQNVWPEYGEDCELNHFYMGYKSCAGWIGDSFINIWSKEEVAEYEVISLDFKPNGFHIFGSDGGGTYFGFKVENGAAVYFSCDPIDITGSIVWLGSWSDFLQRLVDTKYV